LSQQGTICAKELFGGKGLAGEKYFRHRYSL
jgi:hypothetical protein